jgi:hypothetical protein
METNKQKVDPIDEALRLWMLSERPEGEEMVNASEQLKHLTSANYKSELSDDRYKKMIDKLYRNLAIDSLGIVLEAAISKSNIKVNELAVKTSLPEESIEQLKADSVFANSIPVISLRDLLKELQIPFAKAEEAIIKSFHILKSNITFHGLLMNNVRLAYRRKNSKVSSNTKSGKSDSQYLFENEEALTKYLKRLNELY